LRSPTPTDLPTIRCGTRQPGKPDTCEIVLVSSTEATTRDRRDGTFSATETNTHTVGAPGKQTLTERLPVQRKPGTEDGASGASSTGSGRGLDEGVRAKMEHAFGTDFSAVRVHEGSAASAIGALAYTQGTDLHFAPGEYQPETVRPE